MKSKKVVQKIWKVVVIFVALSTVLLLVAPLFPRFKKYVGKNKNALGVFVFESGNDLIRFNSI